MVDERTLLNRLRSIRENMGISQGELAQRLHMTQASYGRLENGQRSLKYRTLVQIIETLNIDQKVISSDSQLMNESAPPYKNALRLCKESLAAAKEKIILLEQTIDDKNEIIKILKSK